MLQPIAIAKDQAGTRASMAEPVTRHALISEGEGERFRFLLCGIDTLDLGFYVTWNGNWKACLRSLDSLKIKAQREKNLILKISSGRKLNFYPGGKGSNYRYHLEFEDYHLFISKSASGEKSPNVYVSLNSRTIWLQETKAVLKAIAEDLRSICNGAISFIQVSRCDLTVDFLVPGGLSLEFLQSHKVSRSRKANTYLNDDRLETYYAGDKSGTVQLRIYDKSREVLRDGKKLWFWDVWGMEPCMDIWRVEFQLRRAALKQYGVDSLDDLHEKMGGIWKDLTETWFSLRLQDNESSDRRTLHPFWKAVHASAERFGPIAEVKRNLSGSGDASVEWFLSHIDGCLSSFAARLGAENREEALEELGKRLNRRNPEEFKKKTAKRAISSGIVQKKGRK